MRRRNVKAERNSSRLLRTTMPMSRRVMPPIDRGWMVALRPRISRMLAMFDPTTLPSASSDLPFRIEITDEAITAEFAKSGAEDPAALEKEWREAGRLHLLRTGLLRQAAIEDLMENAKVTEVDFAAQKAADEKKAAKKPAKKKAAKKADAEEEAAE